MWRKGYTIEVNKLLRYIFPSIFFTSPVYFRAIMLAAVYLGVLLAELFHFEELPGIAEGFNLPGGHTVAVLVAGLLPLLAAVSLPYLISMRLSKRTRTACRTVTIATPAVWAVLGLWLNISTPTLGNTGLFGATVVTPVGWWIVVFSLLWLWSAVLVARELPFRKEQ